MAAGLVVNEVLWYIQHYFDKFTRSDLSSVLISFYTIDELTAAKRLLFGVAETVDADYLPVYTDRKGVNKVRATVDDLLGLYALFDVNKIDLPQYVVLDPNRVPTFSPANSESVGAVSALTSLVHELKDQVAALSEKLQAVCDGRSAPHLPRTGATAAGDGSAHNVLDGPQGTAAESLSDSRNSFADKAALLKGAIDPFKRQPPPAPKLGKRKSNDKVKAIPRYLVCFVGRLHIDTTDDDLRNYLAEAGIKDAACRKLEDKNGFFRTAAFRVSCSAEYRDLFYDESTWPEGAELRDWVFRRRDGTTSR